jgi:hypothetical protein
MLPFQVFPFVQDRLCRSRSCRHSGGFNSSISLHLYVEQGPAKSTQQVTFFGSPVLQEPCRHKSHGLLAGRPRISGAVQRDPLHGTVLREPPFVGCLGALFVRSAVNSMGNQDLSLSAWHGQNQARHFFELIHLHKVSSVWQKEQIRCWKQLVEFLRHTLFEVRVTGTKR